jgi:hypothetical protein
VADELLTVEPEPAVCGGEVLEVRTVRRAPSGLVAGSIEFEFRMQWK